MTTSLAAHASPTLEWLRGIESVAIPVYQREYRWTQAACEQLLDDARAAADRPAGNTHFIGSLLVKPDHAGGLTLVDGQQRITTLMLLVGSIREHASASGAHEDVVAAANDVLVTPSRAGALRLITHQRFQSLLNDLLMTGMSGGEVEGNPFADNYQFLLDRIAEDWPQIWQGLQRLEQVTISLGEHSNAQQIFESLNSTGAPLADDELIHNYVHMGRTFAEQSELESGTWSPIENATAGATREFWRDYLVLTADEVPDFTGGFGVYRTFRERFPDPLEDISLERQAEWRRLAEGYRAILHPENEPDDEVANQLRLLGTFGGTPRPFILAVYDDYRAGLIRRERVVAALEQMQTMLIRRGLVGLATPLPMVGLLCRELRAQGYDEWSGLVARTPEDAHVRLALTHTTLPHADYVLSRLQGAKGRDTGLQIEHIHPQNPNDNWSGDGSSTWGELSINKQARYRTLLNTIGNLTLLEAPLNQGASNRSFLAKGEFYRQSAIKENTVLAGLTLWDAAAIETRTRTLVEDFVGAWPRPRGVPVAEASDLIRVVDLARPALRGYPEVFEHAEFRGALWGDVQTSKQLLVRLVQDLCQLDRGRVTDSQYGYLVRTTREPRKAHDRLSNGEWLYTGWAHQYLLEVAQTLVTEFGLEDHLRVKLIDSVFDSVPSGA